MPKLKTNRGAKKRFKCTGSGKIVHKSANRRHLLTKKPAKRKRQMRGNAYVDQSDVKAVKKLIGQK